MIKTFSQVVNSSLTKTIEERKTCLPKQTPIKTKKETKNK